MVEGSLGLTRKVFPAAEQISTDVRPVPRYCRLAEYRHLHSGELDRT